MHVFQYKKVRNEHARCEFERVCFNECADWRYHFYFIVLFTANLVAMRLCQFETDNDEQAKCELERNYTTNVRTICYIFSVCVVYSVLL